MTSLILPQLTDYSLENRDQHVMFCYFVQKHTPTPQLGDSSKNCGQSLPSSTSFPSSGIHKEPCQPFTQHQLFPVPATFSSTLLLYQWMREPIRMAESHEGWTGGNTWWLQPNCRALELLQGCTQGSCCQTINLFPIYHIEPFLAVQCIDRRGGLCGGVPLHWL